MIWGSTSIFYFAGKLTKVTFKALVAFCLGVVLVWTAVSDIYYLEMGRRVPALLVSGGGLVVLRYLLNWTLSTMTLLWPILGLAYRIAFNLASH